MENHSSSREQKNRRKYKKTTIISVLLANITIWRIWIWYLRIYENF